MLQKGIRNPEGARADQDNREHAEESGQAEREEEGGSAFRTEKHRELDIGLFRDEPGQLQAEPELEWGIQHIDAEMMK